MKIEFTIPGEARAQAQPRAMALLPKGGVAMQRLARETLEFYQGAPMPAAQRAIVTEALNLQAKAHIHEQDVDRDWKNTIRWHLIQVRQTPLWDGPILLTVRFYSVLPRSRPKWMHEILAAGGTLPLDVRPDTEQLLKPLKDACTGLIWREDSRVYSEHVEKLYAFEPRVEVCLELRPIARPAVTKEVRRGSVREEVRGVRKEVRDLALPLAGNL